MKLLQKTIRRYFVYSLIVLLIIIPVFYFLMQAIVKEEIDEDLVTSRTHIVQNLQDTGSNVPDSCEFLDHDLTIDKMEERRVSDSFYTTTLYDNIANEMVPHRVLVSHVLIRDQPYQIRIRKSMVDNDNLIEAILIIQLVLLALLFIGLQVINRNLSTRIWRPFYNTLQKLRQYRVEEHAGIELAPTRIQEFDDLNHAIEQLTERSRQAYISQKEFAENASHEMQTPLAIFMSKLELLMQTGPLNQEQAALISSMADASQRMNRLNKTLVLLSKIGNRQFPEKEPIDLATTIQKLLDHYTDLQQQKKLTLHFEARSPLVIEANITLTEILLSNLISNAMRHSEEGGTVWIGISGRTLQVRNTGKPASLDKQKIFQRFYKESNQNNGMGLGLELIKKICDLYGFSVDYSFSEGRHTFSIRF